MLYVLIIALIHTNEKEAEKERDKDRNMEEMGEGEIKQKDT